MDEVFVSYARANEAAARRLAQALAARGFDVWRDDRLPAHQAYSEVIEQKLRDAKAVVVLWSADAVKSQWVRAEADLARSEGKLVQAAVDDTLPPIPFNQIQCVSLKGWRGKDSHAGWLKVADSVNALVTGEAPKARPDAQLRESWPGSQARWIAVAALLLIVAAAAYFVPGFIGKGEPDRPVVAVLPFESPGNRDEGLVSGIWEDTRRALSRNPQLLVLGPNTSQELAEKGGKAARKAADYLVEANVRSIGDRVRVSANLVRTKDGAQVWSEAFERRLDDVFQLQQEIAGEIEGRIRGRLARGGGVRPENIATSGEVYALYSDARSKIRKRDSQSFGDAVRQLRKVVALDPNFAPGWATLSVSGQLGSPSFRMHQGSPSLEESERFARRAIALAPNLAAGHAALGLALEGPAAEAALRRAVKLDPNDIEALNWLANELGNKGQLDDAAKLYARVAEIEPLWQPAAMNHFNLLLELGEFAAVEKELARLKALGADFLHAKGRIALLRAMGDLSAAADLGIGWLPRTSRQDRDSFVELRSVLIQLGYIDEFAATFEPAAPVPFLLKRDPKGLELVEAAGMSRDLFRTPIGLGSAYVYVSSGRTAELARLYRSAASSADEFRAVVQRSELAALIAVALQREGDHQEAERLLATAESLLTQGTAQRNMMNQASLARVHALQGRPEEALPLLATAIRRGWLPPPPAPIDLGADPTFAMLKSDPRFERLRQQILGLIRKERAELGPIAHRPGIKMPALRATLVPAN